MGIMNGDHMVIMDIDKHLIKRVCGLLVLIGLKIDDIGLNSDTYIICLVTMWSMCLRIRLFWS
jgi:hypothetical protein